MTNKLCGDTYSCIHTIRVQKGEIWNKDYFGNPYDIQIIGVNNGFADVMYSEGKERGVKMIKWYMFNGDWWDCLPVADFEGVDYAALFLQRMAKNLHKSLYLRLLDNWNRKSGSFRFERGVV